MIVVCLLATATGDLVLLGTGCEYCRLWHLELVVLFDAAMADNER
jgi:hypothetical protein